MTTVQNRAADRRRRAAIALATGDLTDTQVAEQLGVSRSCVTKWKREPAFQAVIQQERERLAEALRQKGVRDRENRLRALQELHDRLVRVIEERATDPAMKGVPGGGTGLLVHRFKVAGGRDPIVLDEYEFDSALVGRLLEIDKQAAQELGQWTERSKVLGQHIDLSTLSDEQLDRIAAGEDPIGVLLAGRGKEE